MEAELNVKTYRVAVQFLMTPVFLKDKEQKQIVNSELVKILNELVKILHIRRLIRQVTLKLTWKEIYHWRVETAAIFFQANLYLKQGISSEYVMVDFISMGLLDMGGARPEGYKMKNACPQWDSNLRPSSYEANAKLFHLTAVHRLLMPESTLRMTMVRVMPEIVLSVSYYGISTVKNGFDTEGFNTDEGKKNWLLWFVTVCYELQWNDTYMYRYSSNKVDV